MKIERMPKYDIGVYQNMFSMNANGNNRHIHMFITHIDILNINTSNQKADFITL
jgi:hypothetical protein